MSKAKTANGARTSTMGLFKLRDDGPMLPEYKWDDNQHELLQYPENKKKGRGLLIVGGTIFFCYSSLDDKFRTYTHILSRTNREAQEEKESRKSRARKKW